ncbi:MAG: dimethylsulfonioproprionate lyase family protein [Dehalococcoidia bacterium]
MRITTQPEISESVLDAQGKVMQGLIGRPAELGGTTNHSMFYVVIRPGHSFPAHYHKVIEETYYILTGAAYIVVDGQRFSLEPGQAVVLLPGEVHEIGCAGDGPLTFMAVTAPTFDPADVYLV